MNTPITYRGFYPHTTQVDGTVWICEDSMARVSIAGQGGTEWRISYLHIDTYKGIEEWRTIDPNDADDSYKALTSYDQAIDWYHTNF